MPKFQPSEASISPKQRVLRSLRYAKAAIAKLESVIEQADDEAIPPFVLSRVTQGATSFGQALSYVSHRKGKKR